MLFVWFLFLLNPGKRKDRQIQVVLNGLFFDGCLVGKRGWSSWWSWKMDPESRCISYWTWGYSSQLCQEYQRVLRVFPNHDESFSTQMAFMSIWRYVTSIAVAFVSRSRPVALKQKINPQASKNWTEYLAGRNGSPNNGSSKKPESLQAWNKWIYIFSILESWLFFFFIW